MNKSALLSAPSLDSLQIAWLQEIGLDRPMLARWAAAQPVAGESKSQAAIPVVPESSTKAAKPVVDGSAALASLSKVMPQVGLQRAAPVMPDTPLSVPLLPIPEEWTDLEPYAQTCERCELHQGAVQWCLAQEYSNLRNG